MSELPLEECGCCPYDHDASRYTRRERSVRVWQVVQCWALMMCVRRVLVTKALEMTARARATGVSDAPNSELVAAVMRLARLQ